MPRRMSARARASSSTSNEEKDPRVRVVWGLGTGRHIRHAARAGDRLIVFAVDVPPRDAARVERVLQNRPELARAHSEGRLEIVVGDLQTLRSRFSSLGEDTAQELIVDLAALDAAPEDMRPLVRLVERLHVEQRDAIKYRERLRSNLEHNLATVVAAPPLSLLTGAAAGRPAFVLAAGPSARAAIRWLPELRRYGPLIAVDTALPLCRQANTTIDCLASIDPHPSSSKHLASGIGGVTYLAFQPYACPQVVAAFANRVVAVPDGDKLCDALADALELPRVEATGTVLTYAIDVATTLGCNPIVLIGADFAHVGLQSHAAGTASATAVIDTGVHTHDTSGQRVATTHALERFRAAVEQRIIRARAAGVAYWAVDGGGARIEGAHMLSWVELAQQLGSRPPPPAVDPEWLADIAIPASSGHTAPERTERANAVLRAFP